MKRLDQLLAWLILLLALRFGVSAQRQFAEAAAPWSAAFYLLATTLLFLMVGAVNLLRIRYASVAPGLRPFAAGANVALAALTIIANVIGGELAPALVVGVILLAAAVMSLRPTGRPERQ
jgi:hypothetical protein